MRNRGFALLAFLLIAVSVKTSNSQSCGYYTIGCAQCDWFMSNAWGTSDDVRLWRTINYIDCDCWGEQSYCMGQNPTAYPWNQYIDGIDCDGNSVNLTFMLCCWGGYDSCG